MVPVLSSITNAMMVDKNLLPVFVFIFVTPVKNLKAFSLSLIRHTAQLNSLKYFKNFYVSISNTYDSPAFALETEAPLRTETSSALKFASLIASALENAVPASIVIVFFDA